MKNSIPALAKANALDLALPRLPEGRSESPSDVKGAGRDKLSLLPAVQRHLPSLARQAVFIKVSAKLLQSFGID